MENQLYDVFLQGLHVLYMLAAPLVLVLFIAGTLASILQSALAVQESTINYAVRLLALIILLYLMLPSAIDSMKDLTRMALL